MSSIGQTRLRPPINRNRQPKAAVAQQSAKIGEENIPPPNYGEASLSSIKSVEASKKNIRSTARTTPSTIQQLTSTKSRLQRAPSSKSAPRSNSPAPTSVLSSPSVSCSNAAIPATAKRPKTIAARSRPLQPKQACTKARALAPSTNKSIGVHQHHQQEQRSSLIEEIVDLNAKLELEKSDISVHQKLVEFMMKLSVVFLVERS